MRYIKGKEYLDEEHCKTKYLKIINVISTLNIRPGYFTTQRILQA